MKKLLFILIGLSSVANAQHDSVQIRKLYNVALGQGKCYENLRELTKFGGRISGSEQAAKAVVWAEKRMKEMGFDTVYLQECMVPRWVRGEKEQAWISATSGKTEVPVCALGMAVGTGARGLEAEVIEVKTFKELDALGKEKISGKIVFFNRPFDDTEVLPFRSYGSCVDQRWAGPSLAAKYGAKGVVVRSMTHSRDDFPHTGAMEYDSAYPKIPAIAISTNGADLLSKQLKSNPGLKFGFRTTCEMLPDVKSYNVIGEVKGSKYPDQVIVVGGHLDAWDNGDGAHDDGAGCVQSMEVLNIFKTAGIRPLHTIRAVLFMNEENGGRGAEKYAEVVKAKKEKHLAAIESDAGGFSPRGFAMVAKDEQRAKVKAWRTLLEPYGIYDFGRAGAGADVEPLHAQGIVVMELYPDPQRYFDFHHTSNDKFEHVHKRELELGAAAMASLVYLIDRYPLD